MISLWRLLPVTVCAGLLLGITAASAHPHVWATVEITILYDHNAVSALQSVWTFDEMYSAMSLQGLDANNDGAFEKQELTGLVQETVDDLQVVDYFTSAKLGERKLKFAAPVDYWFECKDGILTLYFTLPLQQPELVETEKFSFAVFDPSFMTAFNLTKTDPIKIEGSAPAGCKATTTMPEVDAAEIRRLGEVFPLGGPSFGLSVAATGSVQCGKS